jgi:tetratricopeptide (TPR) repeat protein
MVLLISATFTSNCTTNVDIGPASTEGTVERSALLKVTLPDLSRLEASVQTQVQTEHEALMQALRNTESLAITLANQYGELGTFVMATDDFDTAESYYLNAQALAPDDMRWPYYLGHLYRATGSMEASITSFQLALQLKPDDMATLVWLGDVHLTNGQPDAAESKFERALSLGGNVVAARAGLGRAALARADYRAAIDHFEQALALNGQAASLHYPLALAYRGLGDEELAQVHLQLRDEFEILPPDPLMDTLRRSLRSAMNLDIEGTRALNRGDAQAAIQYFLEGLEIEPNSLLLRYKLGTSLVAMGDGRGAMEQFERVVRAEPEHTEAQFGLGMLLDASGRSQEAIERFSIVVKHEPDQIAARLKLATLLRRNGRPQESLPQFTHVLAIDPGSLEATAGYTMALVGLGRYQEARDRLSDAVNDHPDQPEFTHALARVLAAAPDARVRDGQRALVVMQGLPVEQQRLDLGETMAMALAELSRFNEAVAWQRDAMAAATQAGREDLVQRMVVNLRRYEAGQPCRIPWRPEDLP